MANALALERGCSKKMVLSPSCFFAKLFRSTVHFCEVISTEVTRATAHTSGRAHQFRYKAWGKGGGGGESGVTNKRFAIYFSHPWTPFSTCLFKATCAIMLRSAPRHVNVRGLSPAPCISIAHQGMQKASPQAIQLVNRYRISCGMCTRAARH